LPRGDYGKAVDNAVWISHNNDMHDEIDIKAVRDTLGVNQTQLAELVGVAQGDISNWELGKHKPSRAARATLKRLLDEHREKAA